MNKYKVGDIVENPTIDLMDYYTAEWIDVGVVKITGIVEEHHAKADRSEDGKWANNDFGYTWSELE